ncbi:PilZ domain-containing protein [Sphingomonas sp.]|uniref:PilZ domain-containing protein n=1 Tax=Sphingomonas sp. TaxID=28214 RepID=UPI0025E526CB|nr:PilZ domain-containing protein [Sphingomonas sp.]MBV9528354.1 PilZ domain-containing protein [Sphingomonas sp.]
MDEQPVEMTVYSLADAAPAAPERRNGQRHLSLLRVGSMKIGDRSELCLIKNISAGGMLVRAYCDLPAGARLSVELKQGEPVVGIARWVRDGFAGIAFDEPIDVLELLSLTAEGPRPRMPRVEVNCVGSIREGAFSHRCRAVNISQGGIKLESRAAIDVAARVTVSLFGLQPCSGTVRWRDGECYGITFDRVLPLPALVSWLQDERARLRASA